MEAIVELFVAIIGLILRLCIQLVAALLGAGVMASRRKGLARTGFLFIAASCAYFLFGILRFFSPALSSPGLYGIYTMPVFIGAIAVFFVGAILTGATRTPAPLPETTAEEITEEMSLGAIIGFGLFLVFGVVMMISSSTATVKHQSTLRDRACDIYEDRVSAGLRDTASQTRDLAERLLGRQIAPDITCSTEDDT